ncbi:hypothetical protein [Erythrobacter sp. HL-111]|uniref:hypothetical protein n=1 Tax=Erythrobacter sp. HL-111 TaxID=1798193 RepID=UPI0006DB6CB4|nr:hypothetical protein [Erythrobacter sp. HL-111]KPP91228.1 MAG: HicB family [Erythrobacteraceae bacterium HL-111]SDT06684.1 hypothetical protein SAMN04515621_2835 [Erythrobacter sp. HL-111]
MPEAGFASLGPTLLARKGGAKPAMRPQLAPLTQSPEEMAALADEQLEDLGWNDMGDDRGDDADNAWAGPNAAGAGAQVVPILPTLPEAAGDSPAQARSPVVRRQQKQLAERVLADAAMDGSEGELGDEEEEDLSARYFEDDESEGHEAFEAPAPPPPPPPSPRKPVRRPAARPAARTAARPSGKRAAFTLRLDTERHLKLRLAATMQGVSAQALVTEALDALLAEFEELDALAARMRRN